tara:strand:- start:29 stop:208 length:180 start_codon:yes stop_codon:yes gene_type:complete
MGLVEKQGMTPSDVRKFYRNQLERFKKIGLGNKTDNGVVVTEVLMEATMRRLSQLNGGL